MGGRAAIQHLRRVRQQKSPQPPTCSLRIRTVPRTRKRGRLHQHCLIQQPLKAGRFLRREEPLPSQHKLFSRISVSRTNWCGPSAKEGIQPVLVRRGVGRGPIHRVRIFVFCLVLYWRRGVLKRGRAEDRICAYRRQGVIGECQGTE
jgi:hypothetical protein